MKTFSVEDIKVLLNKQKIKAIYKGNNDVIINSFSNLSEIKDESIVWVKDRRHLTDTVLNSLRKTQSVIVVCPWEIECVSNCLITDSPKETYFTILNNFFKSHGDFVISDRAVVETSKIGRNVTIGSGCFISKNVVIGDNVVIHPNVIIDSPCIIGNGTEIFAGTVIGTDGFGYFQHGDVQERVPHFGGVIIGENVDIGANTCIDRGCLDDTVIGDYVKINNLVHIAHNVKIGKGSLILAGATLCGSVVVGENSYLAPRSIVKNQIHVGNNCFVGMNTVLSMNLEDFSMAVGNVGNLKIHENRDYRKYI